MNRERLEKLKETLVWLRDTEQLPERTAFAQNRWFDDNECGTTMCLGGWYVHRNITEPGFPLYLVDQRILNRRLAGLGDSMMVMSHHFDLSSGDTPRLFGSGAYSGMNRQQIAAAAIERVDCFLAGGDVAELEHTQNAAARDKMFEQSRGVHT